MMIDISKPESKEVLLKLGLSKSKIEELAIRQKNEEVLPKRIIIINSEEKKVMITLPDSPEEIEEKRQKRHTNDKVRKENLAKRKGYINWCDYIKARNEKMAIVNGYKNYSDYDKNRRDKLAKIKGYSNWSEYDRAKNEELAKNKGFENFNEYVKYRSDKLAVRNGFERFTDYKNDCFREQGFKNRYEHDIEWIKKKGYDSYSEYVLTKRYERGEGLPMSENEDCSSYLGIYIAENLLSGLFEGVKMMPNNNRGFDAVCSNEYKIDVKSSCLSEYYRWIFHIDYNKVTDYFLFIAFDNREDLNVLYIWLIKKNEPINTIQSINRKLNTFYTFSIMKSNNSLDKYKKYELSHDKIDKANELCKKFKEKNVKMFCKKDNRKEVLL